MNAGQTSVVSYRYDGLNRRVSEEHTDGSVRDFYHSVGDQVLEERVRDSEVIRGSWAERLETSIAAVRTMME